MKEYKILEVKLSEAETKMNDMAKLGWEVASTDLNLGGVALTKSATPLLITFSRKLNEVLTST